MDVADVLGGRVDRPVALPMKPPRIVQVTDPYERQLLITHQSRADTPALYQSFKDQTYWCDESQLYKWRKARSDGP